MALFDKPMTELREAFVNARFAQEDVFGRSDIEEWLERQRTADRPDEITWERYQHLRLVTDEPSRLWSCATPYAHFPDKQEITRLFPIRKDVQYLLEALHASPLVDVIFYGYKTGFIVVYSKTNDNERSLISIHEDQGKLVVEKCETNTSRFESAVHDIIFAEWNFQGPRWKEARELLCNVFAEQIQRQRVTAKVDFNSAVAISTDGKRIVNADWVFCSYLDGNVKRFKMFPSSVFHERKIRRPDSRNFERYYHDSYVIRGQANATTVNAIAAIAMLYWSGSQNCQDPPLAIYVEYCVKCDLIRIYVTSGTLCDFPLPEGGIEVEA